MAAPLKPAKVQANGKDTWWAVDTLADMAAPTDDEINDAGNLNITCFLLAEQDGVTGTTNKVALARLLCETTTTEGLDNVTWSLADIQGVFDPQAASGSTGKKAWEVFKDGFSGYLVRRQAVRSDLDAAVTAGQFVDVFKVDCGAATPGKSATDASGIYTFTAGVALTDQEFNVAVVAGV